MPDLVSVVVITRNRVDDVCRTLDHLAELPERPPVIVVDNASTGATVATIRARHPDVRLVRARRDLGAAARNAGVEVAKTPYVAFSDDDSWWEPGSLELAVTALDRYPEVALVAARTLVGPENAEDPRNEAMRAGLPSYGDGSVGREVLGFLGCAAVVRRDAFRAVGGFEPLLWPECEERLLAYDLAAAGWRLVYLDDVVAHHHPPATRDPRRRQVLRLRNLLLVAWLRRPARYAAGLTWRTARNAARDPVARGALIGAGVRVAPALTRRRRLPDAVERAAAWLDAHEPAA